ncbi:MAG: ferredoxin [Candidatus Portnoybacteria bacterium CG10_big_fil_rev_8_21_14_0_10_44_7]|uniref:Ferredoxin n=1 Tax=Candidatus Portnoybacteria bacterium CG10_big_fil_rev_8_21_14_0_10_44_7 TaxID=1974816 RepID=A0A2M8KIB2_9BACT|nr:MAG: ferredoxin [Candidatus Portnoybacteria bacterium CG10_big_fil_rev_8_21_14_0_10_44_7]
MQVKQERPKCIGCGSCAAVCPDFYEMAEDGLASIKGGEMDAVGNMSKEITEPGCHQEAADVCPVQIITIIDQVGK